MQVNEILAAADTVQFVGHGVTTELNESVLRPNKRSLGMCSVPRQSSDSLRSMQRFVTAYSQPSDSHFTSPVRMNQMETCLKSIRTLKVETSKKPIASSPSPVNSVGETSLCTSNLVRLPINKKANLAKPYFS